MTPTMTPKRWGLGFVFALITVLALSRAACSAESEITKSFIEALDQNNALRMTAIVEEHRDKIPGEIKALIDTALETGTTVEDREAALFIAETMARAYKEVSGNIELLKEVKKKAFDIKLGPAVRLNPVNGVIIIEAISTETVKNIFRPDNIIIKKGETVRWANNDTVPHIFASMPLIGLGGLFSPSTAPGQSWEYKFEKPGDYYYICFIHRGMLGKITVEE